MVGLWDTPEDIPWDDLPDQVVLKSHTGASSRGVFPLRRIDGRWFVVTRPEPIEPAEVVEQLTALAREGRIDGPFFGQQLIGEGRDDALPTELRVYCFYGEVGVVNVRRATSHGDNAGTRARRYLPDGSPGPRHLRHDDDIELPDVFHTAVDVGRRLSTQSPGPSCASTSSRTTATWSSASSRLVRAGRTTSAPRTTGASASSGSRRRLASSTT